MVDRAEIAVGDKAQRLLAAVVGMHPPSDVGEEAGGMAQSAVLFGLAQLDHPRQAIGPGDQFLGVADRSRQQLVQRLRGADEPIPGALGRRELLVQKAFAHAEGREHDGLRLGHPNDVFEHQRRVGEEWPPRIGDRLDIGQHVGGRQAPQPSREVERVGCRNRVAVHHLERIAALDDVETRQRAPGAADRIEGPVTAGRELGDVGEFVAHDASGALQGFVREVLECQAAERQRHAAAHAVALDVDQLERAAAEVADDTVRIVDPGDDAKRGKFCFARAGQDMNPGAADPLSRGDEVGAVGGVAAGRGGDSVDATDFLDAAQCVEAPQRGQRLGNRVRRQQAGRLHLAAEPAQRLLVEHGDQAARQRLVDDETHRVRANIDDSDAEARRRGRFTGQAPLMTIADVRYGG